MLSSDVNELFIPENTPFTYWYGYLFGFKKIWQTSVYDFGKITCTTLCVWVINYSYSNSISITISLISCTKIPDHQLI